MILAFAGVLGMLTATRFGIGINPDSVTYVDAARNLLRGDGLSVLSGAGAELKPLTHFPPLYSGMLALLGITGAELPSVARWLNAFLFGANIALIGLMIGLYARQSFWLPGLGSFLALTAPGILGTHSFALSEALFIFLTLIGLLCLTIHMEGRRRRFLVAAALAIGLSVLTRYIGLASVLTGVVALLVFNLQRTSILPSADSESPSYGPPICFSPHRIQTFGTGSLDCRSMALTREGSYRHQSDRILDRSGRHHGTYYLLAETTQA